MVMTFIGAAYAANFSSSSKNWMVCTVTVGWLGMALGALAFAALLQLRVYSYISIFIWNRQATGIYFIVPVLYMGILSIIYSGLSFILPSSSGFEYIETTNVCAANGGIYYFGMALMIIQTLVLCVLLFKSRTMECCFHEHRKILIVSAVCIVCEIIVVAIQHVHFSDDKQTTAGVLKILFSFIPQHVYFYVILGPPVYHSLAHSDRYLQSYVDTIEQSELSHVYELIGKCPMGEISDMSDAGKSRRASMSSQMSIGSNFSGNEPAPECSPPLPRDTNARQSGALLSYYSSSWLPSIFTRNPNK
ncbi:hypothetical protein IWW36_001139 [Coemansia brasiliensis]|uniref:G-protein coupled receptors family 3 profile domain-containing protein n=1 Tax=Coemansia brasiliensis TaxID=2650707 RepID=A0A9W8I9I5_9FUNG|nr:hypothetical protein IWW36_001139 [Coemansia brasiliensis]